MKKRDRVFIKEDHREKYYNPLRKEDFFKDHAEVFMMALLYGFINNAKKEIIGKKDGIARIAYFDEEKKHHISIIKAIAIYTENGDLSVLNNEEKIYSIAEKYANGGITLLKEAVLGRWGEDYCKKLEAMLREKYEDLDIKT